MNPKRSPVDVAASVRARLLNLARRRNLEFQLVLSEFAVERLLYRLGVSLHGAHYVLKGAALFRLWTDLPGRATWDLDLLSRGASVVVPMPKRRNYPSLLDHPPPHILVYSREMVVAEKLEAMVALGVTNSRMKDFYDIYFLASSFPFESKALTQAVRTTFERRGTPLPESEPIASTRDFLSAPERQAQWRAFLRRGRLAAPLDAGELAGSLREFIDPILEAVRGGPSPGSWQPGGPWEKRHRVTGAKG